MIKRTERMINYTTLGGKLNRGILVLYAVEDLQKKGTKATAEQVKLAAVLGWCVELLQAEFLVADDIMDASEVRRGQPCWYKVPGIGLDAANDALVLDSFIYYLLEHFFKDKPYYNTMVSLFWDVSLRTKMGQMMDLVSNPQGRERPPNMLQGFNTTLYNKIVCFKTAYYTFYLPLAAGMVMSGFCSPEQLAVAKAVCVEMGEKFQIQDDYLDCFGDPAVIGKVGTDIQDHKCSWLVVQFMERCTPAQLKTLEKHYGQHDEKSIAAVKKMYSAMKLEELYEKQEVGMLHLFFLSSHSFPFSKGFAFFQLLICCMDQVVIFSLFC